MAFPKKSLPEDADEAAMDMLLVAPAPEGEEDEAAGKPTLETVFAEIEKLKALVAQL